MDDLEKEIGSVEDSEDDNDFSDDISSIVEKRTKLPLVNPVCVGEF